jgi:hypothetical protein
LNFDMSIHGVCTRWCVYVGVCVSPGILEVMDDGRAEVIGDARVCVSVHCPPPPCLLRLLLCIALHRTPFVPLCLLQVRK